MRSFIPPRNPRTTVWAALGLWLVALMTGMANACVLEQPGNHEHGRQHGYVHDHEDDHDHVGGAVGRAHTGYAVATDHHADSPPTGPRAKAYGEAAKSLVQNASAARVDLPGVTASFYEARTPAQRIDQFVDQSGIPLQIPPDPPLSCGSHT